MRIFQVLSVAVCGVALTASADVIEIEATVQEVDAGARTITLARKTATGEKVRTFDVASMAGDISGLAAGQAVSITYDTTLRIVAKVTLSAEKPPSNNAGDLTHLTAERITPEEARRLTAETGLVLSLPGLRELSPETARQLATYREQSKTASDTAMVPVSEERTVTFRVMVPFTEEKTLEDGTKVTVAKCRSEERSRQITSTRMVPKQVIRTCPFTLQLDGLASAEPQTLAELAKHRGNLFLNGLQTLTHQHAETLAAHEGGVLALDGLKSLDAKTAEVLAAHEGGLTLNGLGSLSPESAKALGGHKGDLSLDGVKFATDQLAQAVVMHQGLVSLKGVTKASDKAKQILTSVTVALLPEIRAEWEKEKKENNRDKE